MAIPLQPKQSTLRKSLKKTRHFAAMKKSSQADAKDNMLKRLLRENLRRQASLSEFGVFCRCACWRVTSADQPRISAVFHEV